MCADNNPHASAPHPFVGRYCILRCYAAGVHAGWLVSQTGDQAILRDARRLWSWRAKAGVALSGLALPVLALLAAPAAAQDTARSQGYVNLFAGVAAFDSTVTVGGVKLIDQGGDALMGGARAGWGYRFVGGLYLGIEGEAFAASGRSRAVVNGEVYSRSLDGGLGAFGRVGWQMHSGALFFARAGALASRTNQGWDTAPAFGAGAEVIVSGPVFARVDVTYVRDSPMETYIGTVGIGWRF